MVRDVLQWQLRRAPRSPGFFVARSVRTSRRAFRVTFSDTPFPSAPRAPLPDALPVAEHPSTGPRVTSRVRKSAELARSASSPAQVSRFKSGTEAFPAAKLEMLHWLLDTRVSRPRAKKRR